VNFFFRTFFPTSMKIVLFVLVLYFASLSFGGIAVTKAIDNTNACGTGHNLGCIIQTCINDLINQTYFDSKCDAYYDNNTCNSLWANFSKPWINITNSSILNLVTQSDYTSYYNFFNWTSNRGMFWSGTGTCSYPKFSDVVHSTAKTLGYMTLEASIPVSFVNEHHFCDASLYVNGSCIGGYTTNSSTNGTEQGFFIGASLLFAANTYGDLSILISPKAGANPPVAYSNATIFHNIELPNIRPSATTSFTIFAYTDGRVPSEYCGNTNGYSSIDQLTSDAISRFPNVSVNCYNDPPCILKVICKYYTQANRTNYNNNTVCCEQVFDDNLLPNTCTMSMNETFCSSFLNNNSSNKNNNSGGFPGWGVALIVIFTIAFVGGVLAILYFRTTVFKRFRKPSSY